MISDGTSSCGNTGEPALHLHQNVTTASQHTHKPRKYTHSHDNSSAVVAAYMQRHVTPSNGIVQHKQENATSPRTAKGKSLSNISTPASS